MRTEAPGRRRDGSLRFVLSTHAHLPANAALKTRARSRSFPTASARRAVSRSSSRKFFLASHQGPFPHHGSSSVAAPAGSPPLSCSSAQAARSKRFVRKRLLTIQKLLSSGVAILAQVVGLGRFILAFPRLVTVVPARADAISPFAWPRLMGCQCAFSTISISRNAATRPNTGSSARSIRSMRRAMPALMRLQRLKPPLSG
jgi:hypothetical protein